MGDSYFGFHPFFLPFPLADYGKTLSTPYFYLTTTTMMIKNSIIYILMFLSISCVGQTLDDALRYSFHENYNTARFAGVAGAFSALGADVSIASINPAGIAEFRKSEVTGTLNFLNTENIAALEGGVANSNTSSNIGLGNVAAVFHYNPASFNTKSLNFAIGYNRIADFNEEIVYQGESPGTIVQRFLEQAFGNGINDLGPFEAGPAFDAIAIFEGDFEGEYLSDFNSFQERVTRAETITRSGSLNEIFLSVGSNFKNKISWGATLGFPFVNFTEQRRYTEDDIADEVDLFDNLSFSQNLNTSGVGANLKLGIIYKITNRLRFGASIHTRSLFLLTDDFDTEVSYTFTEDGAVNNNTGQSPLSDFEYQLSGAWRAIGGFGYLYKAGDLRGFLSGEVEYVNYRSPSFNLTANSNDPLDQFNENGLNAEIDDLLEPALNIRIGTELAYKFYRLRLGANLIDSPFQDTGILDYDPSFSGGLGYRGNRFYVDVAYTLRSLNTNYSPYALLDFNDEPFVSIEQNRQLISTTFGYKL